MRSDFGMLIARTIIGAGMAAHGAQKAFGAFGGPGLEKAAGFMKMLGFEDSDRAATAASYNEMLSGSLIVAGFLGPIGPALLIANMTVAATTVHAEHGFFAADNGIEVPLLYSAAALALAAGGYGKCSVDTLLGLEDFFAKRPWFYVSMAGALAAALWVLDQRVPPVPPNNGKAQQTPASSGAEQTAA